jgi:UDP-glucuronate 4-epimerase
MNDYYDINLKYARLKMLKPFEKFTFIKCDISDIKQIEQSSPVFIISVQFSGIGYSWRLGSGQSITDYYAFWSLHGAEASCSCRYNFQFSQHGKPSCTGIHLFPL